MIFIFKKLNGAETIKRMQETKLASLVWHIHVVLLQTIMEEQIFDVLFAHLAKVWLYCKFLPKQG